MMKFYGMYFIKRNGKNMNKNTIIIHSTIGDSIFKGFETICQAINELNKIGIDIEWRVAGVSRNMFVRQSC